MADRTKEGIGAQAPIPGVSHGNDTMTNEVGEIPHTFNKRASETPGNPGSDLIFWGNPSARSERNRVNADAQKNASFEESAQPEVDMIWRRMNGIEEKFQEQSQSQAEMLTNILSCIQNIHNKKETELPCPAPNASEGETETTADDIDDFLSADSSDREKNEEDNFIEDLRKLYEEEEKYGPKLDDTLAGIVNNAIDKPLTENQEKELCNKYLVPDNCKKLTVPKINRELWQALKANRASDLALQTSQKAMSIAMVPVIKSMEIIKNKGDVNEIKSLIKDTFRLLAHGLNTTNRKRKALIRPKVPEKYRKVCENDIVSSEFLFGDDLDQKVDAIEKEEKRVQKLTGKSFNRVPFLGQRFPKGKETSYRFKFQRNQKDKGQSFHQGKSRFHRGHYGKQ